MADSTTIPTELIQKWQAALASGIELSQIVALRQISSHELVRGLATEIVKLSGAANDDLRMWAAEAMENSVQASPADVGELISLMEQSPDGEVCYWSATMLGRLGIQAAASLPALENCMLHSEYLAARERAVWAISQIGPAATAAIPTLRKTSRELNHPRLQRMAAEAIRRLENSAPGEAAA